MRDQWSHVQGLRCHEIQNCFEVALLGPAHKPNWIVVAFLFVTCVVAPGAVRTGHLESDFLLVKILTRKFESGNPNQHNPAGKAAWQYHTDGKYREFELQRTVDFGQQAAGARLDGQRVLHLVEVARL